MEYKAMQPPFEMKDFDTMTKKEAEVHLKWFISQTHERLEQLKNAITFTSEDKFQLDYSPESLISIWKWFIPQVTSEQKNTIVIMKERMQFPEWLRPYIGENRLSDLTVTLAMDIGIYFSEVLIRNGLGINWGIPSTRSKSYVNYNRTVLLGFKAGNFTTELDPCRVLYNLTLKVAFDKEDNTDLLLETYCFWRQRAAK